MPLETAEPLVLEPPRDLLERVPRLNHLARQLSMKYVYKEVVTDDDLEQMGRALWEALDAEADFQRALEDAKPLILPLVIASQDPAVMALPWETLHHPTLGFLGCSPHVTLLRRVGGARTDGAPLDKGPLRVLLFTSLPDDLEETGRLDTESERENVLEAFTPWVRDGWVTLEAPDDGRFDTFQKLVAAGDYHVVFLSGHGMFQQDDFGDGPARSFFVFERDDGRGDPRSAEDIAACFAGQAHTRAVVLSACQSGRIASDSLNTGLAMGLIRQGIPLVAGMREPVLDLAGIRFARAFCDAVGGKERVDTALQTARQAMTRFLPMGGGTDASGNGGETGLGQWCLPVLYARASDTRVLDWDFDPEPPHQSLPLYDSYAGVEFPERFIGRRRELRTLLKELESGATRLLVLTGMGGMGKTALACRLAKILEEKGHAVVTYSARREDPWNAFVTDLHLTLEGSLSEQVNQNWGRLSSRKDQYQLLIRALMNQTQGRLVLLLDNLETVQDPDTREINDPELKAWLEACSAMGAQAPLTLLTSRRQVPGLEGAKVRHHPLEPASYGDFVRYAQEPAVGGVARDHLRAVYRALGGNFKGLQFFAQAGALGVDEGSLLQRVREAQEELRVYAALESLVERLQPEERTLLSRMRAYDVPVIEDGVFLMARDLEGPEGLLENLVAYSLLDVSRDDGLMLPCYSLNPVLVEWLDRVEPAPEQEIRERAADHQLRVLRQLKPFISHAIVCHGALVKAERMEEAHQLVLDYLADHFMKRGMYQSLRTTWLPPLLESSSKKTCAMALNFQGMCTHQTGDSATALQYLKQSLAIVRDIGERAGECATLNNISQIYQARGDFDTALVYLNQSMAIVGDIGDRKGAAATLNNISQIYGVRGDVDRELECLNQSMAICREIQDRFGEATCLNSMGMVAHDRGDYDTARDYLSQSLAIRRKIGDRRGEGATLNNISQIYKARGDNERALEYLNQSLAIQREIGDPKGEGTTLNNISLIYEARGEYDPALEYLNQSLAIQREIGDRKGTAASLINISQVHQARGDHSTALKLLKQSLAIQREIRYRFGEAAALNNMATSAHALGDYSSALEYLNQSLAIQREIGDRKGEAASLNNISQIYQARGEYDGALQYLKQSLAILGEVGEVFGLCHALFNMGLIHTHKNKHEEAMSTWVSAYALAKKIQLAQVLTALDELARRMGQNGLAFWEEQLQQAKARGVKFDLL